MSNKKIAVDSTVLLKEICGVADSRILSDLRSLIEAEAVTRLKKAEYTVCDGYCHAGEFGIDLIGETAAVPQTLPDGRYLPEGVKKVLRGDVAALLSLDSNGYPRRAAATSGLINLKPTYGTVSRYGTVPVVSSADTVGITAKSVDTCRDILNTISGSNEKDPTVSMLTMGEQAPIRCVGIPREMTRKASTETRQEFIKLLSALERNGIRVLEIPEEKCNLFAVAHTVWNTVLCAEAWGNLSRYDGVRYGNRADGCTTPDEIYTASRSEGFGELVKATVLYGSYALSPDSDGGLFFKVSAIRNSVKEATDELFAQFDGILIPACSVPFYTVENIKTEGFTAFSENLYTAFASICGLPAVTVNGIQIIGNTFSDRKLLDLAEKLEICS